MTLQNTTKIALLFSVMVLPIGFGNAYADGSAEIVSVCGFTTPNDIPLGLIVYGVDGDEVNFSIDVEGNGVGTLELDASNWNGLADPEDNATMIVRITSDMNVNSRMVFSNIIDISGDLSTPAGNQRFYVGGTVDEAVASFINQLVINPSYPVTGEDLGDGYIKLTTKVPGFWINIDDPEDMPITYTGIGLAGDDQLLRPTPLVLPSITTRYTVTTDGTPSNGTTYQNKTPLLPPEQSKVLTTEAYRTNPVNLSFQLTGVDVLDDVDYIGAIQQTWLFTYSCTE